MKLLFVLLTLVSMGAGPSYYGPRGRTYTHAGRSIYLSPNGHNLGSSQRFGGSTYYYGPNGNYQGRKLSPIR